MRKKILALIFAFALALAPLLFGGAAPVAAHGDHTSCAQGARTFAEALDLQGPGLGPSGEFVSGQATGGIAAATVLGAHLTFCDVEG